MNVFFGKISKSGKDDSFFENQLEKKRYYAKKDSGWFGEIQPDDYCFIVAGENIYLWKAISFETEGETEYLQFESVIDDKLPINGKKFKSFKYFQFNPQIIVLTTRKARNRAFFKIVYLEGLSEEILTEKSTYESIDNFRKIMIVENETKCNDTDIFLIKEQSGYRLYKSNFIEQNTFNDFVDNTSLQGQSNSKRSNKDSTIKKIKDTKINDEVKDMSLLSFYDLFFNVYKTKDIDENPEEEIEVDEEGKIKDSNNIEKPLNQILYGPPGTGKTYNTINKALEIILESEPRKLVRIKKALNTKEPSPQERKHLKKVFEYYKVQGQIEFVTFHQSYGYEEFVEGIKAKTVDKNVQYSIESGIFKNLCEKAKSIKTDKKSIYDFDNNINIWKISLGDSQNSEYDYLFDYCIKNNKILLGFGDGVNFTNLKNRDEISKKLNDTEKYSYPPTAINTLKNKMKQGDIVLVSHGNKKLRAIAKITEEYSYIDDENLKSYVQSRGVEWLLIPKEPFSYGKVLKKQFSQMSIYDIKSNVKINDLRNLLAQNSEADIDNNKNYILIIDEINRGNISKIFGELITLVEPSKRIGADEEIRVKLPYSGDREDPFGVPSNLYIIGTMNTADRSIAQIDTALRRRFVFEEMMPNSDLFTKNKDEITDISKYTERQSDLKVNNNINIRLLLNAINERIEYIYDREHTIGHSYFMELLKDGSNTKDKLDEIFRVNIIPLLAEYFYGDWGDIVEILNDDNNYFIEKKQLTYKTKTDRQNKVYTIKNEFSDNGYRNIYDGLNEKPSTDTAMDNDQ